VQLRPYQKAALDALDAYWNAGGGHPLCVLATGTGKSVLIAKLIQDIAAGFPKLRVVVLVHVRELLDQNLKHLLQLWPDAPYGINSAGLRQRNWDAPIVLANIQSVWRNPQRLGVRHLVVIDESHLVPHDGDGMYRSLLDGLRVIEPSLRVCGFTATPYRLDSGRLDEGDGRIFDKVVTDYGIADGIRDGWLAPLSSKATTASVSTFPVWQCAAVNSSPARWRTPPTMTRSSPRRSMRSPLAARTVAPGFCSAAAFAMPVMSATC